MSFLSKKKKADGTRYGHTFDSANSTVFGGARSRINKEMESFSNDYLCAFFENPEEDNTFDEKEVGTGKEAYRISDSGGNNKLRDVNVARRRKRDFGFREFLERLKGK